MCSFKMMSKLIFVLTVSIAALTVGASDYCKLCSDHVACNNPGVPSSNCSNILEMTGDLKKKILEIHNKLRNQQASGQTAGYEPATRMGTMQWDDELAKLAWYNAITCNFGHDKCRKTDMFAAAGQNIAGSSIKGTNVDFEKPSDVIEAQTNSWFNEYKDADMTVIRKYHGGNDPNIEWGHFTQVVRDNADRIGCAMSQYIKPGEWYTNYLVCDYAYSNLGPVYDIGATASKCTTGTNPDYPALCSENEKYEY